MFKTETRMTNLQMELPDSTAQAARSPASGFPIAQLDSLFAALPQLTEQEAREFQNDVAAVVGNLQPEGDAWAS